MKAILLVLALFVCSASALPLTGLSLTTQVGSGAQVTQALIPTFATYKDTSLRYAAEIDSVAINTVRISWTGPASVQWRNCGSSLQTPTAATSFSYCSTGTAYATVTSGNPIQVTANPGTTYIEIKTTDGVADYFYVVQLWIVNLAENNGYNMLVLEPVEGFFASVFLPGQAAYSINYVVNVANPTIKITYAAQKSVFSVQVQSQAGVNCAGLSTTSTRTTIASRPSTQTPQEATALQGQYSFVAQPGNNCVRFWNRVLDTAQGGENEQSISVYFLVYNCQQHINCITCTNANLPSGADAQCGWCGTRTSTGSCWSGTQQAPSSQAGASCSRLLTPRSWSYVSTECPPDVIRGDPRIQGLQGQDFQVHGMPNEYFNLVSSPIMQLNSRFVFLESGACDNFTTCFSHAGTYIDELGLMIGSDKVRVVAGSIKDGARVYVNGKEIKVSSNKVTAGKITVVFSHNRRVILRTPEAVFTADQSDKFFNVATQLLNVQLLDKGSKMQTLAGSSNPESNKLMHGLIGQTWLNNVYAGNREYEGEVSDYLVQDGLWGSDFAFNLYH